MASKMGKLRQNNLARPNNLSNLQTANELQDFIFPNQGNLRTNCLYLSSLTDNKKLKSPWFGETDNRDPINGIGASQTHRQMKSGEQIRKTQLEPSRPKIKVKQ